MNFQKCHFRHFWTNPEERKMGSKNLEGGGGSKYFGVKFLDFRNIKVKQNTILDTRQYGMMPVTIHKLPSEENPGFVAAWSPSPPPPIFIGVAEPYLSIVLPRGFIAPRAY